MPAEPARDPRLMCERCGEFGAVVQHANGNFSVERYYKPGRLCCCTVACKTREEAIRRWDVMWNPDAEALLIGGSHAAD